MTVRSRGQQMPIDMVLFIVGKTAEALHAAHELRNERGELRHLVHRDVTPSNVLISRDGQVKLIDFGVAKARERLQNNTTTNTLKGKFGYMSPEQARGVKNLDRRSDLWSLGVVLWECLAGRRLFKSESELEILRMVTEDTPASVRTVRTEVPEAVDQLLSAVFAKNRDDRLGSCAEFADYLWAVFREEGFTTNEKALAAFFRQALPDRCASLDRLFAGEDWHIEPTSAGPGSGSFSGTDAQSGIATMQPRPVLSAATSTSSASNSQAFAVPSSQVIFPAANATGALAPVESPSPRKTNLIVVGAIAVALVSLGGAALVIARAQTPSTTTVSTARSDQPATQSTATSPQQPAINVAPTTVAQPTNPNTATPAVNPSNTAAQRNGSGRPRNNARPSGPTPEQTANAMLRPPTTTTPAVDPPSSGATQLQRDPPVRDPAPQTRVEPTVARPPTPPATPPATPPTTPTNRRPGLQLTGW